MKIIELTQNQITQVDDEDYERLNQFKWYVNSKGYAVRNDNTRPERGTIRMHNEILNCPANRQIDHRDTNKLNNQKSNLRLVTFSQQAQNVGLRKDNASGYKGVSFYKKTSKWRAYIALNAKPETIGYFYSAEDAARAYDKKAIEYFGVGAKTNFPQ